MKKLALVLLMLISLTSVRADSSRMITGMVYDNQSKQPLPGVIVQIKGTKTSIQTDSKGHYAINIMNSYDKLTFSFIGYKSQTIDVKNKGKVDVYLQASSAILHDVVVVGYSTQQKTSIIGSATQVQAAPLNEVVGNAPVSRIIQGRAAGLMVNKVYPGSIYPQPVQNTESYKGITENGFQNPKENPLSTFSVDVDAASYSNVRRFINNGQLPPKDAVRIEEMINYFGYNLLTPTDGSPVAIHTELSTAPWNPEHQLVRIGLKAKAVNNHKLPASNLVFLVDVSGSMIMPNKLPLVQSSMKLLVDQLRPQDKVAIVVYAGQAGLVLPSTSGSQKTTIKDAIDRLSAGGSTAGGEGIKLAYRVAKENFMKNGNNRVILATDGDFNVGASSDQDMEHLI
ncbi:vWA domain-containing protein [Mucilaginibacter robiniae]|uniref:vWA domain-containing protein n=1 Tax=Mucilaginibacter robiniae TaxID=2728022 RepID=UPI002006E43E|nr:von Willebrand factor type A domain-containing protein [Mucilaginibacter robiniae]